MWSLSLSVLVNTQVDVVHTTATNTHRNSYSPFSHHREMAPRTQQNTQDFSLLSQSSKADLSWPYHMQPQCSATAWTEVHQMLFGRRDSLLYYHSLTVLIRVCCWKHLSFISQQKISLGKDYRTEHGGFISATGPPRNNRQELASFLFHLVHSNSVSNYCSNPFLRMFKIQYQHS